MLFCVQHSQPKLKSEQPALQNPSAPRRDIVTLSANCGQSVPSGLARQRADRRGCIVAYQMIAERDDETVWIERVSTLIVVANAKVWASEGWQVEIVDESGRIFEPADFGRLLAVA
jgi:hypothetical protein